MCGIVGRVNLDGQPVKKDELGRMCLAIKHRGPDGQGIWTKGPVGLANRRLAIIDLSSAGNQPMTNETKTVWLVFNGEMYNFLEWRKKLIKKGHRFRSRTDTEAVVHLWEEYGIKCLHYLRGMFALALWDDRQKILFLARDRLGKKPLKYFWDGKSLIFASELKAILKAKGIPKVIDPQAIDHYFSLEAVPEPLTGFKNINKLPAGSYLVLKNGRITIKPYWQLGFEQKLNLMPKEWQEAILAKLTEAVKLRLVADVEIGAFLSGGIDSSTIVALMHQLGHRRINTFSVGFADDAMSELPYARLVAKKFSTRHHETILKPQSFRLLPKLAEIYEEPYGDPSALPTYLVSQLASKKLKVVLNGDGGDENFAGYQRYQKFEPLNLVSRFLPAWTRKLIKAGLNWRWPTLADLVSQPGFGDYPAAYLSLTAPLNFKKQLYQPDFFQKIDPLATQKLFYRQQNKHLSALDNVLLTDIHLYLGQVLLPKVDIASMAHGLEVRSPFLDQELVELTAQMPASLKLKGLTSKYILKQAVKHLLPAEIINRPKMGFGFPLGQWLRHQWQAPVKDILLNSKAKYRQFLQSPIVEQMINQPLTGEHYDRRLWRVIMLELWLRHYFPKL